MPETTALTPQQSFEKKLEDRIRADIGDLIPDEMLSQLIGKAIEKSFFEERTVQVRLPGGYYEPQRQPPWIVTLVKQELDLRVKDAVGKWITDNEVTVEKMVQEKLDAGIVSAVVKSLDSLFEPAMLGLQVELTRVISHIRSKTTDCL